MHTASILKGLVLNKKHNTLILTFAY